MTIFSYTLHFDNLVDLLLIPACIVLASLTAGIIADRLIRRYIGHHLAVEESTWKYVLIRSMQGVPIFFSFIIGLYWAIDAVEISPTLTKLLSYLLFTSNVFSITRVLARTVDGVVTMYFERSGKNLPKTTLLNSILIGVIYAMGLLVILQYYGISIAPILTAAGVGGMAVALALQETLSNIFSGLHLILSKQVRVGDYIRLDSDNEGRVTDITWRYTTILTSANNTVVVPNAKLSSAILTNYDMPEPQIAVIIPVGVSYDSDLEKVETVTVAVAADVMERLEGSMVKTPAVFFHTFGDSSIDFNVVLYARRFTDRTQLKHEFIKALTQRYREEGIDIPFPVRTILRPESSDTSS